MNSIRPARPPRRGLAPLEFVLCLPVLLFTMALMVSFGTAAAWKVRTLDAARQAVWRDRAAYRGGGDPVLASLPSSGRMSATGDSNLTTVAPSWDVDPITHPMVRNFSTDRIQAPQQGGYVWVHDKHFFEMDEGVRLGTAHVDRRYAMLPKAGRIAFDLRHSLLDTRWQYHSMGYGGNYVRRARYWYELDDAPEWASQKSEFLAADQEMMSNPSAASLAPLDRDEEFLNAPRPQCGGNYPYGSYRDFIPRLPGGCDMNPITVRSNQVQPLIDSIQGRNGGGRGGVPDRMASAWINLYQYIIDQVLSCQDPLPTQEIQRYQDLIDQLRAFQGGLS